jgi:hypothetical protein
MVSSPLAEKQVKDPTPKVLKLLEETFSRDHHHDDDSSNNSTTELVLVLSNRDLANEDFPPTVQLPVNLLELDLSRNRLGFLPSSLFRLEHLIKLDVSRNHLKGLPPEIQQLRNLQELSAVSNKLRLRLLPLEELASLSQLRLLDLQYNSKLKQLALDTLRKSLTQQPNKLVVEIRCTVVVPSSPSNNKKNPEKRSACDRDATQLQSQLEPLSTPQLRKRLERTFGVHWSDDDDSSKAFDREVLMTKLLECYQQQGPRQVRLERGIPVSQERLDALLHELEANIHWPHTTRERPKIRAEYYMILQKPGSGQPDSVRTRRETAKLERYRGIFDLAVETMREVDPVFCERFTALAVTKNFVGSPHIDTLNIGAFYGLALVSTPSSYL